MATQRPVSEDTVFRVASITKTFTAIGAAAVAATTVLRRLVREKGSVLRHR